MYPRFTRSTRSRLSLAGAAVALALVTACSAQSPARATRTPTPHHSGDASQVSKQSEAKITSNIRPVPAGVDIERKLRLRVASGHLRDGPGDRPQGRRSSRAGLSAGQDALGLARPRSRRPRATASPAPRSTPRAEERLRVRLPHPRADARRADLPQLRAAPGPDRRCRHAGDHPVRRARHGQGLHREAPQGGQPAGPGGRLPLDQRPGGALAPAHLLAARAPT